MAKAQLMAKRFQLVAKTGPCGKPKIHIAHEVLQGIDYFWPKVSVYPSTGAACAKATFSTWVRFNDSPEAQDGGSTVYAYTYL